LAKSIIKNMHKYQLIFLGTLTTIVDDLVSIYKEKIDELKLQKEFYEILFKNSFDQYKGNQPTFVIYFGNTNGKFEDLLEVEKMLKEGNIVLPVFFNSFRDEIPPILKNQNGIQFTELKKVKIIDLVLESFGKLRNTRKIFISYKRDESTSVAIQLYEALEKNNFDVFLDTHSIKQGEPFQEELWHRMTDSDVILLLNTEKFLTSEWCEQEIAEASVKQIGIIQVVWPNNKLERMAEVCFPIPLKPENFINNIYDDKDLSKLNDQTIDELVNEVESVRARNLASRQDNLITEFLNTARKYKKNVTIQPERFITEELADNKRRIFIPSVGIPQSFDCNTSSELKKEIKEYSVDEVYLIYDDVRIREKWIKHLSYLNEYLDVKTIKKQEFDLWLQKN